MSKRTTFTTVTPLPAGIGRETAVDILHDHIFMMELNPLVIEHFRCQAPPYASAEEFHCVWYQLKDKISYLPGVKGNVTYSCAFHDLPDGLQTHCYAPLGVDIRDKWSIGGALPGEARAPVEMGVGLPKEGLYLREDCDLRCNFMATSFVKKNLQKSHSTLVERLVEKAHIVERQTLNSRLSTQRYSSVSSVSGSGAVSPRHMSFAGTAPPGYAPQSYNPAQSNTITGLDNASIRSGSVASHSPALRPVDYNKASGEWSGDFQKPIMSPDYKNMDPAYRDSARGSFAPSINSTTSHQREGSYPGYPAHQREGSYQGLPPPQQQHQRQGSYQAPPGAGNYQPYAPAAAELPAPEPQRQEFGPAELQG